MISEYNNAVVTNIGQTMIAKQVTDESVITFTRFAVGDGTYTSLEKEISELELMDSLKSEKNDYPINSTILRPPNTAKLKFTITNYDPDTQQSIVEEDYYANEIGLFAKLDNGDEELFSICVCTDEHGDSINAFTGNNPIQIINTYSAVTSNTDQIEVDYDGAYALAEDLSDLSDHVDDIEDSITTWKSYSRTLVSNGWNGSNQQTIGIDSVTSNSVGSVGLALGVSDSVRKAASKVHLISQNTSALVFEADTVPSVDIPIIVNIQE